MFVQIIEEMEQLIHIPVDEYEELIKCKTQMNAVYGLLTNQHVASLELNGRKAKSVDIDVLELVSGYEENRDYFEYLKENFKRRNGR